MRPVRYISFVLLLALAPFARGQFSAQFAEASKPLTEGVPEVAVVRLQGLLKQNLAEPDWRAAAAFPEVKLHLYGKSAARPGRKMGHLVAFGDNTEAAAERALAARAALTAARR